LIIKSIKFVILALVVCTLFPISSALAHTPKDPNFLQPEIANEWLTLKSSHFNFHFEPANRDVAIQLANVAERLYTKLTRQLDWVPATSTEVLLLDNVDFSNGMATPVPYNRIQIYLPNPINGTLLDHSPWLEQVFTHEFLHVLQLDIAQATPKVLRGIFGRLGGLFTPFTFPQLFAPSWVTEGFAVYGESENNEGFGRLNGAWYESAMRMEVQRGLRSLTEVSFGGYSGVRWPYGQNYIYGAYFMQFIEARYGRDVIDRYFQVYSNNLIPWRMDNRSYQTFGQSAQYVWAQFQTYLKQRFGPQLTALDGPSAGGNRVILDKPFSTRLLTRGDKGDIYYYYDDAQSSPTIRKLSVDGESQVLFSMPRVNHLAWHEDSGLLISREVVCENSRLYTDLYLWQPDNTEVERLTECGRYRIAAWRPDGEAIAVLQLDGGRSQLVLLSKEGAQPELLSALSSGDVLGHFSWSLDGDYIVAAVKRISSGWNIEQFDLHKGQWRRLTSNADIEIQPNYSLDGSKVIFLSDRDGVWNLRQLQLDNGEVTTLSHTVSAVTEVVEMPDGHFRLLEYGANGMKISEQKSASDNLATYSALSSGAYRVNSLTTSTVKEIDSSLWQVQPYQPWSSMRPRSWFPLAVVNSDETSFVGLTVQGGDALGFHRWSAIPLYYYDQNKLGGLAYYSFDDRITLTLQRQFVQGFGSGVDEYVEDERRAQLLFNHYLNGVDRSYSMAAGMATETSDIELIYGSGEYESTDDTLAGIVLGYDSSDYYRRSISLENGREFTLTVESYDLVGQSDHVGESYRVDWSEYLSLGSGQVMKLRMTFAQGGSETTPYKLGGEVELLSELGGATGLGLRHIPLRGFASGDRELAGNNMGLLSLEWRYSLGLYHDGWFVPPVGLGRHSLALFVDSGDAWFDGEDTELYTGIGAEWKGELLLGYNMIHVGVTVGVAHGFGALGEDRLYFKLGTSL
jgi:hypothetical protein